MSSPRRTSASTGASAPAGADARRRQARGDARRQQIIDAAIELFAARGYRGTGITPLAEKVGLTHPGLLYYFGTKERLMSEVVEERERVELELYGEDLAPDWAHLVQAARFNASTPTLIRLYVVLAAENLDRGDPLHEFFVQRYDLARYLIRRLIRAEFPSCPQGVVARTATEVLATIMGLEIQWLMDPEAIDLVDAITQYVDGVYARLGDSAA